MMTVRPETRKLLAIGLALLLPALLSAQDPAAEETDVRRYTVEFVIFRYAEDVGLGTEIFPPEELPAEETYALPAEDAAEGPIFTDVPIVAPAEPAAALPARDEAGENTAAADATMTERSRLDLVLSLGDALTIRPILDRLERLDVYEPLLYGGWTQATLPKEEAEPLQISLFAAPPPGLDGSFTLYLGRFLHLVVDLTLDASAGEAATIDDEPAFSFGDARFGFEQDPFRPEGRILLRIQEDRIMKNGEIRYFDHPKFGVVAKVMRVEPPEETEGENVQPTPSVGGFRE